MAKTRVLVQRRKAIRNIRKITRTMELIATSRFQKALTRAVEAEAFTRRIAELAADLGRSAVQTAHPLMEKREPARETLLLVITSNRGLCGGYNSSVLRTAMQRLREIQTPQSVLHLELSGKRAIAYFRFQGIDAERTYTHFEDKPTFEQVEVLANRYLAGYTAQKLDRVEVAYMKFINAARQTPVVETLLPLDSASAGEATSVARRAAARLESAAPARQIEYEFLPDAASILAEILPISFKIRLLKCFLDAAVSEQIARRVAMKAATESADEMIKLLSRQYNRERQAQITKELAEVIGGAEALK